MSRDLEKDDGKGVRRVLLMRKEQVMMTEWDGSKARRALTVCIATGIPGRLLCFT